LLSRKPVPARTPAYLITGKIPNSNPAPSETASVNHNAVKSIPISLSRGKPIGAIAVSKRQ
jgi:hypothetical protein